MCLAVIWQMTSKSEWACLQELCLVNKSVFECVVVLAIKQEGYLGLADQCVE